MAAPTAGPAAKQDPDQRPDQRKVFGLALGALGIVFGDIGTSPLYAMRESFTGTGHELAVDEANVLGICSLIFWSLVIVITVKYLLVVMRASNDGEGGIMALVALIAPRGRAEVASTSRWVLVLVGLFGTSLLYGDGIITPAISVLSAVEGLEVAVPALDELVVPIAVGILVGLFLVQRRGTGAIGSVFGPVMVVWFVTIAVLGASHLGDDPSVLRAIDPSHAARFFATNTFTGFLALGSVFLVVTGGEALYADMGHFGKRPIVLGWLGLVLPALVCSYFGQGAMLLADPTTIANPFFSMAPGWFQIPLVVLATAATVIASQALISGAFSLTMQAVQLGYSPRVRIRHTSATEFGQIYVGSINYALMAACIALVISFGTSTRLAAAYGVAVTTTMVITTLLFWFVSQHHLGWSRTRATVVCCALGIVDLAFFGANLFKIHDGGWFPLAVGAGVFTLLTTWHRGRLVLAQRLVADRIPLERFVASIADHPRQRVPGTAIYLYSNSGFTPPALLANLHHNEVLHERVVVLSVVTDAAPRVHPARRLQVHEVGEGFLKARLHFGFMEEPDVTAALRARQHKDPQLRPDEVAYFLGRESLSVTDALGIARWRKHLFALLSRNATPASNYFRLPAGQTIEIGVPVAL